jgi:hypothetical protein
MNTPVCFGTTEYSKVSGICTACKCYVECGVVMPKIKRAKRVIKFDRHERSLHI